VAGSGVKLVEGAAAMAALAADPGAQAGPVANGHPLEGAAEVKFEAVVTTGPGRVHCPLPRSVDLGRGIQPQYTSNPLRSQASFQVPGHLPPPHDLAPWRGGSTPGPALPASQLGGPRLP
jgi:hypothetical protein